MSDLKLTKQQRKDRERIEAWIYGRPFQENSRSKPAVPDLYPDDVLETFVPGNIADGGQYFTPIITGDAAVRFGAEHGINIEAEHRVLEPCAGIGNLLAAYAYSHGEMPGTCVDAYEIDRECFEVGRRLWANQSNISWHNVIPFDDISALEEQYDVVIMNPPFGTRWGMSSGYEMSLGKFSRSEHLFLELAIRALKPGGKALVIAPYNLVDKLPKLGMTWFDKYVGRWKRSDVLPGEFAFTKIVTYAYVFERSKTSGTVKAVATMQDRGDRMQMKLF